MEHHRTAVDHCPKCHHEMDTASDAPGNTEPHGPKPGDVSVCLYCTTLLRFDDNVRLVELTAEQLNDMPLDVSLRLLAVRRAILETLKE